MFQYWINKIYGHTQPDVSKSQWFTAKQIRIYQENQLQRLIQYVSKEIPYYQKLFKQHQIKPKHIRNLKDLEKIPVLTRKLALENHEDLINHKLINFTHYSGATTGQRLKWMSSKPWAELFTSTLWRGFSWTGLQPTHRVVSFYSRVIGEIVKDSLIIREAYDKEKIDDDLEKIRQFKPDFAYCYASAAYIMATHLLKNNLRLPLKGVITTSDQLYSHYREAIEEAFQCKVYNNYGCNDGGAWGAECAHREGFHHDFERAIMEFTPQGKMIMTDLWNYAMPLIRYENGDSGHWLDQACSCGRAMPLFQVEGRINDYIITPTQIFSPTAIDILLRENKSIEDMQVVQQTETDLEIFYVPKPSYGLTDIQHCLSPFLNHVKGMNVILTEKTRIERPASNKKRICLNLSTKTIETNVTF